MVKRLRLVALVLMAGVALTGSAQATIITPDSFGGPFCLSSPFGSAACGITTEYAAGGLVFDGAVAVFDDPPHAWGGINGTNVVDLISPVGGYFVMPSSSIFATTGFLSVEIGDAAVGSLLLSVFDVNGNLLGSSLNDDGFGPNGRTLATLSLPGMHSFVISGTDTWGMNQIEFSELVAVPEPTTLVLLGGGLVGLVARRRRRS